MPDSLNSAQALQEIQILLQSANGDTDEFIRMMKESQLPSLSFSKVSTVESCQYRFYLQYVLHLEPEPVPEYFIKGKLLHALIAQTYRLLSNQEQIDPQTRLEAISRIRSEEQRTHLMNAAAIHLQNLWQDCEVLGIEVPFVMLVDPQLPPMIGVIDLLLKQGDRYIVIDHKSGRDFYPPDQLQMAIYRQWLRVERQAGECQFFYEHYRWVNNLQRIRKPAFLRSSVELPVDGWPASLERINTAYAVMQRIRAGGIARRNGDCYRCPYRAMCA
jgi:hypothetical protein